MGDAWLQVTPSVACAICVPAAARRLQCVHLGTGSVGLQARNLQVHHLSACKRQVLLLVQVTAAGLRQGYVCMHVSQLHTTFAWAQRHFLVSSVYMLPHHTQQHICILAHMMGNRMDAMRPSALVRLLWGRRYAAGTALCAPRCVRHVEFCCSDMVLWRSEAQAVVLRDLAVCGFVFQELEAVCLLGFMSRLWRVASALCIGLSAIAAARVYCPVASQPMTVHVLVSLHRWLGWHTCVCFIDASFWCACTSGADLAPR